MRVKLFYKFAVVIAAGYLKFLAFTMTLLVPDCDFFVPAFKVFYVAVALSATALATDVNENWANFLIIIKFSLFFEFIML